MRLKADEYTEFEMAVAGYQFPHLENEPYDSDRLNIQILADFRDLKHEDLKACIDYGAHRGLFGYTF